MFEPLPKRLNPLRDAAQGRDFQGRVPFRDMGRLAGVLASNEGEAEVEVHLAIDEERRPVLEGRVRAQLTLTCQRCLGPMVVTVDQGFALALVRSEAQAERLPERYEPLLVDEELMAVVGLVEDELILALPQIPLHDPAECRGGEGGHWEFGSEEEPGETPEHDNPFAALAILKSQRGRGD